MKRFIIIMTALLVSTLLAACGKEAEQESAWIGIVPGADLTAVTERTEYYDLIVESEEVFDLGLWEKNPEQYYSFDIYDRGITLYNLLSTQFVMEEPVQLWSEVSSAGVDICLYRKDGSRELLMSGLPDERAYFADAKYEGYVDRDKNCYFYRTEYPQIEGEYTALSTVMKILPTGEVQYKSTLEPGFQLWDIRQMEDGRIYLLLNDNESCEVLEEMDPDTGQIIAEFRMERDIVGGWKSHLGAAGVSPIRVTLYGIDSVDIAAQSISPLLYFDGTSYGLRWELEVQDFRVMGDGTIDFLCADRLGQKCIQERMRMEKVEKIPVVLRGYFEREIWLSDKVALFNQKSRDYHVVLETCGVGNDPEDFARLTSIQIGAGKGPDIVCGKFLDDYISGMLDKGALEVLNPYIEASGIREEDYFPLVFATWRQGEDIYSVTPLMMVFYDEMDAEVLGSSETPDIETLVDALLAREGNAVYRKGLVSGQVLNAFLQGSESLWGMVDWEAGTCDFNTPLFGKLLEAARRYGYDDRRALESEMTFKQCLSYFFSDFNSPKERKEKGRVAAGTLFDDGFHMLSTTWYNMAINSNSTNKEGAWEFIAFLLGEEVQNREELYQPPVHKKSFDKWLEWELWWLSEIRYEKGHKIISYYYGENTSEEKREAYKKAIEDARPLPIRTAPILAIILDDAEDYFNGSKSAEEVSKVINNRVQLYLDERK